MAHEGQEIFNPRTGQRMYFAALRPELLRIETEIPPSDEREPRHIHPRQRSAAEVLSGSLVFEVDGDERRLRAGDSITIPAGVPHRFWNDGDDVARSVQTFEPALSIADFFEELFALAAAGELRPDGMPKPLRLAVMIPAFGEEIRPVSPPWPLIRTLAWLLRPIARLRGHRNSYTGSPSGRGAAW